MAEREHVDFNKFRQDLHEWRVVTGDFRSAIQTFNPRLREAVLFGDWSLKDMVAHFSAWGQLTLSGIERAKTGEPIPILFKEEYDEFNAQAIDQRRNLPWEAVVDEYIEVETALGRFFDALSETESNATLIEFATLCIEWDVEHYQGHMSSITEMNTT